MTKQIITLLFVIALGVAVKAQTIDTYAGGGPNNVPATSASLFFANGVAADVAGNIYIATQFRVYRVDSSSGTLTTIAGNGISGFSGDGAQATAATLGSVRGVAVDALGNIFIADQSNQRIRKVAVGGIISTVAGNGSAFFSGDGGPATSASLNNPFGVAVDTSGNIYIAELTNQRIRKVNPAGVISTFAGNGISGFSGDGGPATSASLSNPIGLAVDASGNVYIADQNNQRIRKVNTAGVISTVAGNGLGGFSGDGGPATSARFANPTAVSVDTAGNLYVVDQSNARIRKVNVGGTISTVAGNGVSSFAGDGGPANSASLFSPSGVAADAFGNIYIADTNSCRIRKVSGGVISTFAGNGSQTFSGDGGPATSGSLNTPVGVTFDAIGNLYIVDNNNQRIRKVGVDGVISTIAGNGIQGFVNDNGPATSSSLSGPYGAAVDAAGNVYIADPGNNRIRKVNAGGTISTFAGNGTASFSGDGGPATSASLNFPVGVAFDVAGNLYIADYTNRRIRKVSPAGTISTVAGNGTPGFSGDNGPATAANLNGPFGVALDSANNLYIADYLNQRIRKVNAGGTISTVAGNGTQSFSGDGGPATSASLNSASGLAVDAAGNLYIADYGNHRIRKVGAGGIISTVAGNGSFGFSGDGGPATSASLSGPVGVAVNLGNIYIPDANNNRIRRVPLMAATMVTVTCSVGPFTYVGSAQTPCTATVTDGGALNQALTVNYTNNVTVGTATASASYAGDASHTGSNDSKNFAIGLASSTTTINCPTNVTYNGSTQTPCTASVTGAGGLNQSLAVNYTSNVNAGAATASASYAGDANHTGSSNSTNFTIAKAATTTAVTCTPGPLTYDSSAQTPCTASVTGAGGLNQSLTINYTNNVNAGAATASASYAGDANHTGSSNSTNFTIAKAATTTTVTCAAGPFIYDGSAQTPCTASVTGAGGLNQSLTVNYTNNVNAGTATASASFAADSNHTGSSDSTNFTIAKAATTTTVTCAAGPLTYDGSAQTPCTATVTGGGGLNQSLTVNYSGNVNAGTATASAAYSADTNHTASSDSTNFTIVKATTTTSVICTAGPFTYDGSAQTPCTATVTDSGSLNQSLTVTYSNNVNAGTATANASYASDSNHTGSSDTANFTIDHASSTVTVNCATNLTYDGSTQTPCTASVTGAGGLNQSLTTNYTNNVNAGTATASASFAGDANHTGSSDSQNFNIALASSTTTVNCPTNVSYDGSAQTPCTASVIGAGGLNQSLAVNYTNNTDADSASAAASFAGDANHAASSDSKSFEIATADSTTVVTCLSNQVYTGSAIEPCTVSVSGPGGLNLTPTASYTDNVNVGSASANYTYAGDANHHSSSDSKHFAIHQATSTTTVTCAGTLIFTGSVLEPCTASVTGAGGLSQSLPVSYSDNSNAGNASASASYAGDANHSSSNDSTNFVIGKASSTTTVNCAAGPYVYTGAAQAPCTANVTGAGGLNQSSTVNYIDNINAGNATASASFAGDANHVTSNDSKVFTINKAQLSVTADNKSMMLGSSTPPTFTASYSGFVGGQTATSLGFVLTFSVKTMPLPGSSQTVNAATPAGTYAIVPSGLNSNNYGFTYNYGLLTVGGWTITGFYQPVDMSVSGYVINTVKGGSTVPLKFNIYAGTPGPLTERKSVADVMFGSVQFAEYPCTQTPGFETPLEITSTGNTSLRYDTSQFIQNWQTPKVANKCYQVRMTALDGSHIDAYFKTK